MGGHLKESVDLASGQRCDSAGVGVDEAVEQSRHEAGAEASHTRAREQYLKSLIAMMKTRATTYRTLICQTLY